MGLIGIVATLLIFQKPLGFVAILGILALLGMIARNAVILIDQIENERAEGKPIWDAVVEAAMSRFRPIMLTAISTVLGMIPIAATIFWGPMSYAIMGGLLVATVLTLIFLPALYIGWFRVRQPVASARSGYRLARLEMSQHRETGGSRKEVLERMTAQDEIPVDRVVVELEQLGKRIERGGSDPVERAGIFGLAHQEQQRQGEVGKELHPAVEPQIPVRAPQQQTEYSGCEQRPEQDGSQPCAHALLDDDRNNRHEAQRHG